MNKIKMCIRDRCTDKPVEYIREIATKEPMLVREENTYDRNIKKKNVE